MQAEAGILVNMWLCAGEDVTSDSDIQQSASPRPLGQMGTHSAATRADGWSGDGTDRALAWLTLGVHYGMDEKGLSQGCGNDAGKAVCV